MRSVGIKKMVNGVDTNSDIGTALVCCVKSNLIPTFILADEWEEYKMFAKHFGEDINSDDDISIICSDSELFAKEHLRSYETYQTYYFDKYPNKDVIAIDYSEEEAA
jgi:hypothetical protein